MTGNARTHRHREHEAEHVPAFASYRVRGEFLDEVLLGLLVQDRKPEPKDGAGPRDGAGAGLTGWRPWRRPPRRYGMSGPSPMT
ncbi:hypothetical protein AB0941_34185 [Streptomyces sp. NPDC013433]|uniref:hypothetical protein n=1 Tax=Streptomyces sp. NPDC013433 TaxID=3155604 RepID=UPI003456789C